MRQTIYRKSDGLIVEVNCIGSDISRFSDDLYGVLPGPASLTDDYVVGGVVVARAEVTLAASKTQITADGEDSATVTVSGLGAEDVTISVADQWGSSSETLTPASGEATSSPIVAEEACTITVSVTSAAHKADPLTIEAVAA